MLRFSIVLKSVQTKSEDIEKQIAEICSSYSTNKEVSQQLAASQVYWSIANLSLQEQLATKYLGLKASIINSSKNSLDMLGTNSLFALANSWDRLIDNEYHAILVADGGSNYGGAMFRVCRGA
jgi:hypothetical protein